MKLYKMLHDITDELHYCKNFAQFETILKKYIAFIDWKNHKRKK